MFGVLHSGYTILDCLSGICRFLVLFVSVLHHLEYLRSRWMSA